MRTTEIAVFVASFLLSVGVATATPGLTPASDHLAADVTPEPTDGVDATPEPTDEPVPDPTADPTAEPTASPGTAERVHAVKANRDSFESGCHYGAAVSAAARGDDEVRDSHCKTKPEKGDDSDDSDSDDDDDEVESSSASEKKGKGHGKDKSNRGRNRSDG